MRELERTVSGEFALDTSKLQRIVSVMQSSFSEDAYVLTFAAALKNQKRVTTHDLQDLIAIDNTIANPVVRLEISAHCESKNRACTVIFRPEDDNVSSGIPISVKSDDVPWASNLFSQLEEQVERTILGDPISNFRRSLILRRLFPLILSMVIVIGLAGSMLWNITRLAGTEGEFSALTEDARAAQSTEQKIDFVFRAAQFELKQRERLSTSAFPFSLDLITVRFVMGAAPFILVLGLVVFVLKTCYPGSVFVWGDYGERYKVLLSRRSHIWNVVVIALFIGLLINLSSAVISRGIGI